MVSGVPQAGDLGQIWDYELTALRTVAQAVGRNQRDDGGDGGLQRLDQHHLFVLLDHGRPGLMPDAEDDPAVVHDPDEPEVDATMRPIVHDGRAGVLQRLGVGAAEGHHLGRWLRSMLAEGFGDHHGWGQGAITDDVAEDGGCSLAHPAGVLVGGYSTSCHVCILSVVVQMRLLYAIISP